MPATTARTSYGAQLQTDFAGGTNYATFAEIPRIDSPDISVTSLDATNLNSPNAAKEFLPGLIDNGHCGFDIRYTGSALTSIIGALRKKLNFKVMAPLSAGKTNNANVVFLGFFIKLPSIKFPEDGVMVIDQIQIKVTGLMTFTDES